MPDTYTLAQAASHLGRSPSSLRVDIGRGALLATKTQKGNKAVWVIGQDELDRLLARQAPKPKEPEPSLSYQSLISQWTTAKKTGTMNGRVYSQKTIDGHDTSLKRYWKHTGLAPEIDNLTPEGLEAVYQAVATTATGCGYSQKDNTYKTLLCFGEWLVKQGHWTVAQREAFRSIKPRRYNVERRTILSASELEQLLRVNMTWEPNRRSGQGYSMQAAIYLMSHCGLRLNEALALQWTALQSLPHPHIVLIGKGQKRRKVGLTPEANTFLETWRRFNNKPYIVINQSGRPYTPTGFSVNFQRIAKKAGLDITPHGLRRCAATQWVTKLGMPLPYAQLQLGHASITTTEKYIMPEALAATAWLATSQAT